MNDLGIQTTEWAFIEKVEDVSKNKDLLPGILKTNTLGYDGHGQFVLNSLDDIKKDWCFTADYILEKKVDLMKEISVILTRYQNGAMSIYEPIENMHKNQILKHSKIPAEINDKINKEALESAKKIAERLNYVGTMAVEYFINKNNDLLLNEIAPRVHNSGHLTINAFNISQFEGHVRAVCNLENIAVGKNLKAAEMINILSANGLINIAEAIDYGGGYGTLSKILNKYLSPQEIIYYHLDSMIIKRYDYETLGNINNEFTHR